MTEQRHGEFTGTAGDPTPPVTIHVRDEQPATPLRIVNDTDGTVEAPGLRTVIGEVNGVVKDYSPPGGIDGVGVIAFDARPKDWRPEHAYTPGSNVFSADEGGLPQASNSNGAVAHPTDEAAAFHVCSYVRTGLTGAVEPEWGVTVPVDGEVVWQQRIVIEWEAELAVDPGDLVVVDGDAFVARDSGETGTEEPDWPSVVGEGSALTDGTVDWGWFGPIATWGPGQEQAFIVTDDRLNVIPSNVFPTTPDGFAYALQGFTKTEGMSGATEPIEWAVDSSTWTEDGDLIWLRDDGADPYIYVTGIKAPAAEFAMIALLNRAMVDGDAATTQVVGHEELNWIPYESEMENRIDAGGIFELRGPTECLVWLVYTDGLWRQVTAIL